MTGVGIPRILWVRLEYNLGLGRNEIEKGSSSDGHGNAELSSFDVIV